jgi:hypothetical protein
MQAIAEDRSAERTALRVAPEVRFRLAQAIVPVLLDHVECVERLVTEELEQLAAEPVRAGLRRRQHDAADRAVLR